MKVHVSMLVLALVVIAGTALASEGSILGIEESREFVAAELSRSEARYMVCDDGEGFDTSKLPDLTDPAYLDQSRRRGLVLIHAFMDEVSHNDVGNQITMVKRCEL